MTPNKKKKSSLKQWVRGVFNKGTSDTKANKKSKKEQNTMANEVKKDETKKTDETVETKKDGKEETVVDKKDETTKVDETKKTDEEPKTEEKTDETPTEEPAEPTVNETPESGNGILIEDLVTKEEMHEMFAGLNAKIDALLKENQDLKDENAKLREKYEDNGDFGTSVTQGVQAKSGKYAESFEEYSKPYMK